MKPVIIYSKDYCPDRVRIKNFFHSKGIPFTEIDLTKVPEEMHALVQRTGMRTVPQVFVGETFCGGCDDTLELDARGELAALLADSAD